MSTMIIIYASISGGNLHICSISLKRHFDYAEAVCMGIFGRKPKGRRPVLSFFFFLSLEVSKDLIP